MIIMILFICFNSIFNEPIPIQNLQTIIFPKGNTEYIYQFSEPTLQDGKDAYFFFKFTADYKINLTIIDEDAKEYLKRVSSDEIYYKYKIENLKSQKYIFVINSNYWYSEFMTFIDNSREINIKFENLLTLNFDTEKIEGKPPLPLIFNLDSLEEKIIILFNNSDDAYNIYDGNSKLEYCEINENECNFKDNETSLILEKGKKYKIKYNCNEKASNTYSFTKYKISSLIKEVDMGFYGFSIDSNYRDLYFILDVKNLQNFYFYVQHSNYYFYYAFINEEVKKDFIENKINFNSFDRNKEETENIIKMNNTKDYLIIHLEYDFEKEEGFLYFFSLIHNIKYDEEIFEIEKGAFALISKNRDNDNERKYILVSSNKNMGMFDSISNVKSFTNILFLDGYHNNYLIYVDSSKEKTNLKYYAYTKSKDDEINLNIISENYIDYNLNKYGPDSLFMRTTSNHIDFIYNYSYLFGLDEKYYLYNKKYYGNIDFYKYNKELNCFSDFIPFIDSYHFLNNLNEYDLVNNKLLNVSGYQLFSYFNSYGSLYDLYFQKVNDLEHIQINSKMFRYNNLVKLLNENKLYYLDFNVDHLIKLDKEFLEAEITFIDINNIKYVLNKENKVLRDLKGEGIIVKSNKKALIYFYKKMDNITEQGMIEFNKSQIGKNMKFQITSKKNSYINLFIAEDFGFKGYYPMLSKDSFSQIDSRDNSSTIYVDNLYDKLEKNDFYEDEDENFYIYIFDSENNKLPIFNSENYNLSESIYFDNLLSPINKNYFKIVPGNSNGSIILNIINKQNFNYQFFICKNNEIKFIIENSNGYFDYNYSYPYEEIINENRENIFYLNNKNEILSLSFESNEEFVFSYSFIDNTDKLKKRKELTNLKIKDIKKKDKNSNVISINFYPNYKESSTRYIIVIAPKNKIYSKENLSNPCFITKLITEKIEGIKIVNLVDTGEKDLINVETDITDILKDGNKEFIVNIISQELRFEQKLNFYSPYEYSNPLEDKDKKGLSALYIILISVFGLIIIVVVLFILKYYRKKNNDNFEKLAASIPEEKLMDDI